MAKSGTQIAAEYVQRLERYLAETGDAVPTREGKADRSAVALANHFDRQVLYKNPKAKELLDNWDAQHAPVAGSDIVAPAVDETPQPPRTDRRDRRIKELEEQNASLRADLIAVRAELRRYKDIDEVMIQSGRRTRP